MNKKIISEEKNRGEHENVHRFRVNALKHSWRKEGRHLVQSIEEEEERDEERGRERREGRERGGMQREMTKRNKKSLNRKTRREEKSKKGRRHVKVSTAPSQTHYSSFHVSLFSSSSLFCRIFYHFCSSSRGK